MHALPFLALAALFVPSGGLWLALWLWTRSLRRKGVLPRFAVRTATAVLVFGGVVVASGLVAGAFEAASIDAADPPSRVGVLAKDIAATLGTSAVTLGFVVLGFVIVGVTWVRWQRLDERACAALGMGNPRRYRAIVRALGRTAMPPSTEWERLHDANGLFWEGQFERALARVAPLVSGPRPSSFVGPAIELEIAILVFLHRIPEARARFDAHSRSPRPIGAQRPVAVPSVVIDAMLLFHEEQLAASRSLFERLLRGAGPRGHTATLIRYYLAAIACAEGRLDDSRALLASAASGGGSLFLAQWAVDTHAELFPDVPTPPRPRSTARRDRVPPHTATQPGTLVHAWRAGWRALIFRGDKGAPVTYAFETVAVLLAIDLAFFVMVHLVELPHGTRLSVPGLVTLFAPVALFAIPAVAAMAVVGHSKLTAALVGTFYAALPALLVAEGVLDHLTDRHALPTGAGAVLIAWTLLVFVTLVRRLAPGAGIGLLATTGVLFAAGWSLPAYLLREDVEWWEPPIESGTSYEEDHERGTRFLYDQAGKTLAAESGLLPERPGVVDLYFLGFAGSDAQDVFLNESRSAQLLFDERFDTRGRSLLLANGPTERDTLPAAIGANLAHALKAIGARMNPDEDILFLMLTSHGSGSGLALQSSAFPTLFYPRWLSPSELRKALDEAGIRWRVLMISACGSGIFVDSLRDESTIVATASARDRLAFGCGKGLAYTEFGRAVLDEQLRTQRSFVKAFAGAAAVIASREAERHATPSLPQLFVGSAIAEKLHELEARLDEATDTNPPTLPVTAAPPRPLSRPRGVPSRAAVAPSSRVP